MYTGSVPDFPENSALGSPRESQYALGLSQHSAGLGHDASAAAGNATREGTGELKFVITEAVAQDVLAWARQRLSPDPHAGTDLPDGYHVNTLYLDTPRFDIYHRVMSAQQGKYRLRRYGHEHVLWCEAKRKETGLVFKRRVAVHELELADYLARSSPLGHSADWFPAEAYELGLHPICQVTYQRMAHIGTSLTGTLRLTMDNDVRVSQADGWQVPRAPFAVPGLIPGLRILELKYRGQIPGAFRELILDHRLQPTSFSKYRRCVEACIPLSQLVPEASAVPVRPE